MREEGLSFFDTNILHYAFLKNDPFQDKAISLLEQGGQTSVQALNEYASSAFKKFKRPWVEIEKDLDILKSALVIHPLTLSIHARALYLTRHHQFSFYDALMFSCALENKASVFYSEDLSHGFKMQGLEIRNPFR